MKKLRIIKFNYIELATIFSARTIKPSAVMLGDDGVYWVVSLATMEKLLAAGYELAV